MKLGIMQPYFFPYLGYFDLINYTDTWIIFDTVQYIRHGWINRNRILHPKEGWQYIVVPLKKHSLDTGIKEVRISNHQDWAGRVLGQLQHYKKRAPYYRKTIALVEECTLQSDESLSRLNTMILEKVCRYLGINFEYRYFSEMDLEIEPVQEAGDWALRISEALGAEEYINPPGGVEIFDEEKFRDSNIKLTIQRFPGY